MNQRLMEVLSGEEGNYLLPFFWMHEGYGGDITERVRRIYDSGCRAFCLESRPYEDFCGPNWWSDVEKIMEEAARLGMKVWILDDKHFPTGYANGLLKDKYPDRRRWFLREHHADLMGPVKGVSLLLPPQGREEELLEVCAYRRTGNQEELEGMPVLLTTDSSGFLYWDVPEGCWRIFFIYKTRSGNEKGHEWYIDMLSRKSVQVLIEAVYEPHYACLGRYFGNTLAGFFSDEPSLDCSHTGPWGQDAGFYYRTVGQPGVALPWNGEIAERMEKDGIEEPFAALPGLWYPVKERSPYIRLAYMDAVTGLWEENFSRQLGNWCRSHGVEYIGHVIEDMNAHARLGCSGGHYFRALDGQDMSGIDIVLHQVMPGMAEYITGAALINGVADPEFFHYVLAQLGASKARLTPHMKGRAMCEVFGAYGWAEGAPFMKWLVDFLLIRGINHFVPHAFTDFYPDPDCPPHFHAGGNDPQYEGFSKLMRYTNRAAHVLSAASRSTPGAILYHAEAEWMDSRAMLLQKPAKMLYDAHIDFDIVTVDLLKEAEISDKKFYINGLVHNFLVVPAAPYLPEKFRREAERLHEQGVPVFFLGYPQDLEVKFPIEVIQAEKLAETVLGRGLAHNYRLGEPLLRAANFQGGDYQYFMFFNESFAEIRNGSLTLPVKGSYLRADLLNESYEKGYTQNGEISVTLAPGESLLLCFDSFREEYLEGLPVTSQEKEGKELFLNWEIFLREQGLKSDYRRQWQTQELFDITGPRGIRDFSGQMRYKSTFFQEGKAYHLLDLGDVGLTARVILNGRDLGLRICRPYRWDISAALMEGENTLEVIVANTLVHRLKDTLSCFLQIPPSGLQGPVVLR